MSNPNFNPTLSSNDIWRDQDATRCLTDDLNTIEANITSLESDKADADHTHDGYATSDHGHNEYATANHAHNEYATSNHLHTSDYIAKALQFTNDSGGVKENLGNANVLEAIAAKPTGVYTFYSVAGSAGSPTASTSWRYFVHKTGAQYGWLLAFGSDGSVFGNYLHDGNWTGWTAVYNVTSETLWTGARYMNASHNAVPSKKLSECRNGWMLEWSDYDSDTNTASNYNIVHTPIYKRNIAGGWNGQNMMIAVPNYLNSDGTAPAFAIKQLVVYDDKIEGHALNSTGSDQIDVVLRAVYEF